MWLFPALICAQLAQSRKTLCAYRSYRSIRITRLTGQKAWISHLHLLVDLPLYGVRRFSAAFIFRWSPFLHLWHSPGSGWIRSGSLLRVSWRVSLVEQLRVKAVTPGDSGCHSVRLSPSSGASHHSSPLNMRALQAGGSAAEQSPLSPLQHCQASAGNKDTTSGWDFQSGILMTT